MRKAFHAFKHRGFTLIELLIVVAIIAILAAIAVPNFLEAQTRSKVSRAAADMRSIRTGVEAYRVDNNGYPETDTGEEDVTLLGVGLIRITTPISYMTSIPVSPFEEKNIGNPGPTALKNANKFNIYLWVNGKHEPGLTTDVSPADGLDDNFNTDRAVYIAEGVPAKVLKFRSTGRWMLKSVGPDNVDDRNVLGTQARVYDPTNGTVSAGDLVIFSDTQGFATPK